MPERDMDIPHKIKNQRIKKFTWVKTTLTSHNSGKCELLGTVVVIQCDSCRKGWPAVRLLPSKRPQFPQQVTSALAFLVQCVGVFRPTHFFFSRFNRQKGQAHQALILLFIKGFWLPILTWSLDMKNLGDYYYMYSMFHMYGVTITCQNLQQLF